MKAMHAVPMFILLALLLDNIAARLSDAKRFSEANAVLCLAMALVGASLVIIAGEAKKYLRRRKR